MRVQHLFGVALGGLVFAACSAGPEGSGTPAPAESDADAGLALQVESAPVPTTHWPEGHRPGVARYHGDGVKITAAPQCNSPQLSYFDGPIVMQPIIVPVFWSSHVNAALTAPTTGIAQFFADVTQSSYWPWLQEYDTVGLAGGTEQAILGGSATAGVTLTPSLCAGTNNCTVSDAQIQTELSSQITAGNLPAPQLDCTSNARTIYMIEFPPNVTVNGPQGAGRSCQAFCAYHNTGTYGTSKIPLIYGVLMDEFTSNCRTGCGSNATALENSTDTASHELAEAVTDPDIGLDTGTQYQAPAGWGDNNNQCGEIGDICDDGGAGDTITVSGRTWAVQQLWSNKQGKCTSTGTPPAVCSGTTVTNCRLCSCGDNGGACNGATSVCETTSTNVLFGGCEQCTSKNNTCGATGTCNQSATPAQDDICSGCVPKTTCPAGDNCGTVPNGCGGNISCGTCTAPQTCGGGTPSNPNVCGCTPKTTCPAGDNCGTVPNGCGGTINCGTCTAPQTCTANVCGCTPKTTCPAGDNCGTIPDGCGGTINCGTCTAPQTCTANVCGCTPKTTCPAGDNCGTVPDGCGGTINCGSCSSSQTCVSNKCAANTPDAGSGNDSGAGGNDSGAGVSDSGSTADSGTTAEDSGSTSVDSGSGSNVDSGSSSGSSMDSGSGSTMDSGSIGTEDAATDGALEGDATTSDGGGNSLSGNNGGCGCRTAQAREAGPSPALLAFGTLALLGGLRLRRRTRR